MPVFFIQDAIKFPDLVHAVKPEPDREFPQAQSAHDNFWDFVSLMPESTHMLMWVMSDRAIPRSFRFMEGFGVHTFRFVNAAGESTFVKFHWKPKQGMQSVLWDEAVKINGADPDFHRRDLWNAINSGDMLRLFVLETAWKIDNTSTAETRTDIAAVKYTMAKVLREVSYNALHILGSLGTTDLTPIQAMYAGAPTMNRTNAARSSVSAVLFCVAQRGS